MLVRRHHYVRDAAIKHVLDLHLLWECRCQPRALLFLLWRQEITAVGNVAVSVAFAASSVPAVNYVTNCDDNIRVAIAVEEAVYRLRFEKKADAFVTAFVVTVNVRLAIHTDYPGGSG